LALTAKQNKMNIIYKRILNLVVGHNYFKDGFDRFVQLYPTFATQKLLANGKLIFKHIPNGITILYKTLDDGSTPFVQLDGDLNFTFILKSAEINSLFNITNLDESPSRQFGPGKILYLSNNPGNSSADKNNPEILKHEIIDSVRGPLFTYSFSLSGSPVAVKMIVADRKGNPVSIGKDTNGNPFPKTMLLSVGSNNLYEQQIDLRDLKRGRYLITIKNQDESATLKTEKIYVDELLEKENILGIVDIAYESGSGSLYDKTEEYKVQLNRNETFWKYYIVNKNKNIDLSSENLSIIDSGSVNGAPYLINNFERVFASIEINAKTSGSAGNSISLGYSGAGDFPAVQLSGETLTGGSDGVKAKGNITIINNNQAGYTIQIDGIDFSEGTDFSKGINPTQTAANLIAAINGNGTLSVSAALNKFDILVNNVETLVFRSKQRIPFYEIPKTKIELIKTTDNQTIVSNLPNPSKSGVQKLFNNQLESVVYVFI
jgi:hypothetical protein